MDNNEAHEHTINLQTKLTEAQGEIDRLTKENKILTLKCASSLASNLCPDHRDKQAGKPCLACEIGRLKASLNLIIDFIPQDWEMPLGFNQVVAKALKEASDESK